MHRPIDLHVHSNCSDGRMSPAELVAYAREKGAYAMALTDHDTVAGLPEALAAGNRLGIRIVPGLEISSTWKGHDLHILGLGIDYEHPGLLAQMDAWQATRRARNAAVAGKFQAMGIPVTVEQLSQGQEDSITRAHFARWLLDHGYVQTMGEAFTTYLDPGRPCYIPREKFPPDRSIRLILQAGGLPVLAHPMLYTYLTRQELTDLVAYLKREGLEGIETYYSTYTEEETAFAESLAARFGLYTTGGSDFHGSNKPDIDLLTGRGNLHMTDDKFPPLERLIL